MKTPETTNLQPITYAGAMDLYRLYRARFSFVAAPYGVLKTIVVMKNGDVLASPPSLGGGL